MNELGEAIGEVLSQYSEVVQGGPGRSMLARWRFGPDCAEEEALSSSYFWETIASLLWSDKAPFADCLDVLRREQAVPPPRGDSRDRSITPIGVLTLDILRYTLVNVFTITVSSLN